MKHKKYHQDKYTLKTIDQHEEVQDQKDQLQKYLMSCQQQLNIAIEPEEKLKKYMKDTKQEQEEKIRKQPKNKLQHKKVINWWHFKLSLDVYEQRRPRSFNHSVLNAAVVRQEYPGTKNVAVVRKKTADMKRTK